jgi:outer membrane protein TolC
LENNFQEIHQLFRNGFEEEESVEQIQLSLAQANSRLKYAQNLLKIQQDMLKFVIGYPIESPLKLTDELDDIFNEDLYFQTLPNTDNIDNNIDIRIADNTLKSEALKLKLEKSKALPKVNAFINRTYTGNSNEFTFTDGDQKWYGSSLASGIERENSHIQFLGQKCEHTKGENQPGSGQNPTGGNPIQNQN